MTAGTRKRKNAEARGFRPRLLPIAVAACFVPFAPAHANPVGPQVVSGQVAIQNQGPLLQITNTPGAVINWQGFSIGAGETTRFIQQSAASSVLNRVVGPDPSLLLGSLSSNGKVFLVNPAGILVGEGARIDVAGLVASTLNLSNENFLGGTYRFEAGPVAGAVRNLGEIRTPQGGSVYLVGSEVSNGGLIHTPQGEVILAAGSRVQLTDTGTPGVKVEISGADNRVTNLGKLVADSGRIGLVGAAIANHGLVDASDVVREGGRIFLKAKGSLVSGAESQVLASGADGGAISVESEAGDTQVHGRLEATGTRGKGGDVDILGRRTALLGGARVDVSGNAGGGSVRIGGDYQGKNPDVQNAVATHVGANASVTADALGEGQGGRVIVWSDGTTRVFGSISAKGGSSGGDGGFIETSGHWLDVTGAAIDAAAGKGKAGTWLLDPYDLTITSAASTATEFPAGVWSSGAGASNVFNTDIKSRLDAGTSVTLQTSGVAGDGLGNGDITVSASIATAPSAPASLTLKAHRSIVFNSGATISASGANKLDIVLNADSDQTGGGNIVFYNAADITSNGGDITLGGGAGAAVPAIGVDTTAQGRRGVWLSGTTLNAGGGNITILGKGYAGTGDAVGVEIDSSSLATVGAGSITVTGYGGLGTLGNRGVYLIANTSITSVDGLITLTGNGYGTSYGNDGILTYGGAPTVRTTGAGGILLYGTGGTDSPGICLCASQLIEATGAGSVYLDGTSGTGGGAYNHGIYSNTSGAVRAVTGHLQLNGTTQVASGRGVQWSAGTLGGYGDSGNITITAGGSGTDLIGLVGSVRGTGNLFLQPALQGTTIGIGSGAAGLFNLDATDLSAIQSGFASVTIGRSNGNGAVDLRAVSFNAPAAVRTPEAGGSITVTDNDGNNATPTVRGTGSLKLEAGDNISFGFKATIAPVSGALDVTLNSDRDTNGAGNIVLTSQNSIVSGGGNIVLGGGADPATGYARGVSPANPDGIDISGSSVINAGGGNISLRGMAAGGTAMGGGVMIVSSSTVQTTGSGSISIDGRGGVSNAYQQGVVMQSSSTISSVNGNIDIVGVGGTAGSDHAKGIELSSSAVVQATGSGNVTLTGTGGTSTGDTTGVLLYGEGTRISTGSGILKIGGTSTAGLSAQEAGLYLLDGPDITSTSGAIILEGAGAGARPGLWMAGTGTNTVTSTSGNITLAAHTGSGTDSIQLANASIASTGSLLLQPLQAATTIGIGTGSGGVFQLDDTELGKLQNGFSGITIGRSDGSGTLSVGSYAYQDNLTLRSPSGNIQLNGTLNISAGTGTLAVDAGIASFASGISINASATTVSGGVDFSSGTVTFPGSYTSTGNTGISGATVTFNGTTSLNLLNISAGTLQGTGAVSVSGAANFSGGTVTGTGSFTTGGTSTLVGNVTLDGRTWYNTGTVNSGGLGRITLSNAADFVNQPGGILNATSGSNTALFAHGGGTVGTITNAGTFNQNSPYEINTDPSFNNNGIVNITAGGGLIVRGGTHSGTYNIGTGNLTIANSTGSTTLAAGSDVMGTGTVTFYGGGVSVNGAYSIAGTGSTIINGSGVTFANAPTFTSGVVTYSGGSLLLPNGGTFGQLDVQGGSLYTGGAVNITGAFNITGSQLFYGGGSITTSGTTTIGPGGAVSLNGAGGTKWFNAGTLTMPGSFIALYNGAVLTNQSSGTINMGANTIGSSPGYPNTFSNAGTLNVTGAGIIDSDLVNTGTIKVTSGSLTVTSNLSQSGIIETAGGTTFQAAGGFTNTGTLRGLGTFYVGAGNTLINDGIVSPGLSGSPTGTLAITGNYSQGSTGSLKLDLDGSGAGQYDMLAVSGSATLGGTLDVAGLGPVANYTVLTAVGGVSGGFASVNAGTFTLTPAVGTTDLTLNVVGTAVTWDGGGDGTNWSDPSNWSSNALPGGLDSVVISVAGNPAIVVNAGAAAKMLVCDETFTLASGGTLAIGTSATFNGSFTMTGGTLNGAGNATFANGFNYSSGTVNLSGKLDITHTGNLTLPGMSALTGLTARATGNVILNGAIAASGTGDALVISAGGNLDNSAGAGLSAPAGRWLVYSNSPAGSTENGLTAATGSSMPRIYGRTYGDGLGALVSGNHLVYAYQPTLNVTATAATRVYGDANPTFSYATSGFLSDDGVTDTASSIGLTGSLGTAATAASNVGNYAITQGTLASAANYTLSHAPANLTITPATLYYVAASASRAEGEGNPSFTGTVTGFKVSDTLGGVATGTAAFSSSANAASSVGQYAITGSGLTLTTSNYVLAQAPGNATALTITAPVPVASTTGTGTATTGTSGSGTTGTGTTGTTTTGTACTDATASATCTSTSGTGTTGTGTATSGSTGTGSTGTGSTGTGSTGTSTTGTSTTGTDGTATTGTSTTTTSTTTSGTTTTSTSTTGACVATAMGSCPAASSDSATATAISAVATQTTHFAVSSATATVMMASTSTALDVSAAALPQSSPTPTTTTPTPTTDASASGTAGTTGDASRGSGSATSSTGTTAATAGNAVVLAAATTPALPNLTDPNGVVGGSAGEFGTLTLSGATKAVLPEPAVTSAAVAPRTGESAAAGSSAGEAAPAPTARSDERRTGSGARNDDRKTEEPKAADKKADEPKAADRKSDDKKADDKKSEDDKQTVAQKKDDKKPARKPGVCS